MRYKECGKENPDVILLLHGGGLSWRNFREAAELLAEKYHGGSVLMIGGVPLGAQILNILSTDEPNA